MHTDAWTDPIFRVQSLSPFSEEIGRHVLVGHVLDRDLKLAHPLEQHFITSEEVL